MRGGEREHAERWTEFAALYRDHVDLVYRYCRHRLGSSEDAEDATSQIFLKALSAFSTQREPALFRSWLFCIAHNQIADVYRGGHPRADLAEAELLPTAGQTPEEEALDAVEIDEVHALLRALPVEQRRVIELRLVGLNTGEIAQVLDKTQAAVRMTQSRAIARLRDAFATRDLGTERLNDVVL